MLPIRECYPRGRSTAHARCAGTSHMTRSPCLIRGRMNSLDSSWMISSPMRRMFWSQNLDPRAVPVGMALSLYQNMLPRSIQAQDPSYISLGKDLPRNYISGLAYDFNSFPFRIHMMQNDEKSTKNKEKSI